MTGICIIITTTDTKVLAKEIANKLVSSSLAGCVQISEIDSIYKWENKVINAPEYRLMIKTSKSNEAAIFTKIKELHTYEVPQIISLDITGGDEVYLAWLKS